MRITGVVAILALSGSVPAWAQAADPSLTCRLFPLACPGPVPAPPPPLLGTPEEQAAVAPPPIEPHAKHKRRAPHRRAAAAPAQ
ncbi:hypothetical protein P7D22_17090 [Lichenihabitans sp. Uapishka_5]|uniref:hypothetical protein n=1 Tax=Lichenihabitans sp. Uapishka_5 TaxID=3037302 RepID=UPI0029E802D1|nr:hypothetical protein [Lichenihabitans sp. Uapishka_5]MDX7952884.1 hypothetical protein [Lichenihabitans sp. Uapishka_5]